MEQMKKSRFGRLVCLALGAAAVFALLLLLPPVQSLVIGAGERLKGRGLDHGHWHTALSSFALCVLLFSALAFALLSYAGRFRGLGEMAGRINERRVKGLYVAVFFFMLTLLGAGAYITDGHDWGDDFAEYIMQGISIAEGSYATEHVTNTLFFIYPHGFPLLIAAVYKLFGFNLLAFKMVSVIMYAVFVAVFFLYCDARLKRLTAIAVSFLFAFSPCLYKLLDCILSDTANLLFTFVSLYCMARFFGGLQGGRKLACALAIGFFSFCAYICRDSGIVLPCTFAGMQVLHFSGWLAGGRKGRTDLRGILANVLPYIVFFLLSFWVNDILFASPGRKQTDLFRYLSLLSIFSNCTYYFGLIAEFFYPRFIWFAVFTAIFWAMVKTARQDGVLLVYFLGVMGLYIIWPIGQGIRYIVSALPVLLFFGGRAVELLHGSTDGGDAQAPRPLFVFTFKSYALLAALFCISSLSVCLVAGVRNCMSGRYLANGSYTKEALEMYRYIDTNVSDESSVFFFKPRVLHMTTGNAAVCFQLDSEHARDAGFDYYLHTFDHGYGQLLTDEQARADSFRLGGGEFSCVHENGSMKLFRRTK